MEPITQLYQKEKDEISKREWRIKRDFEEKNIFSFLIYAIVMSIITMFILLSLGIDSMGVLFGVVLFSVAFFWGIISFLAIVYHNNTNKVLKKLKKEWIELAKKIENENQINQSDDKFSDQFAIELYNLCKEKKVVPGKTKDAIGTMKALQLIRQNPAFQIHNAEQKMYAAYQRGHEIINAAKIEEKKRKEAEEKRKEEEKLKEEARKMRLKYGNILMKHIALFPLQGYEKKLYDLKEKYEQECHWDSEAFRRQSEYYKKHANSGYKMEKKGDWAIAGGMASAIGGPIAGVGAVYQTMQNNAAIDQRNAIRMEANLAYQSLISANAPRTPSYEEIKKRDETYEKECEKAKSRLEDNSVSKNELFLKLECTFTEPKKDISGFIVSEVTIKVTAPLKIAKKLDANIDGSLYMNFYNKNELVHSAPLALPVDGVNKSCQVTAIVGETDENGISILDLDFDYVEIIPAHLCLYEKQA